MPCQNLTGRAPLSSTNRCIMDDLAQRCSLAALLNRTAAVVLLSHGCSHLWHRDGGAKVRLTVQNNHFETKQASLSLDQQSVNDFRFSHRAFFIGLRLALAPAAQTVLWILQVNTVFWA